MWRPVHLAGVPQIVATDHPSRPESEIMASIKRTSHHLAGDAAADPDTSNGEEACKDGEVCTEYYYHFVILSSIKCHTVMTCMLLLLVLFYFYFSITCVNDILMVFFKFWRHIPNFYTSCGNNQLSRRLRSFTRKMISAQLKRIFSISYWQVQHEAGAIPHRSLRWT